jgi:hypothetical protein
MKRAAVPQPTRFCLLCWLCILVSGPRTVAAEPTPAATNAFNSYTVAVESRLATQHASVAAFLLPRDEARLRRGEIVVEQLSPPVDAPGALLHHWRATAFAPGATIASAEHFLKDFNAYPQRFAPEVVQARILSQHDDRIEVWMRVRQHHVLTVVMDTTYDVTFARLDATHGSSISRSTRVTEIAAAGTAAEHPLPPSEEHGFLWRQNTYWTYEERDGGLYLQIESVSLTRAIPRGLGWAVKPFVESIPRESLEFTLRSTCNALHH